MGLNQLSNDGKTWVRPPSTSLIDDIHVDERYRLHDVLARKLYNVPEDMIVVPKKLEQDLTDQDRERARKKLEKRKQEQEKKRQKEFARTGVLPVEKEVEEDPKLTITELVDQDAKTINLPHIPSDLRLEFLLKNRASIDEQGRLAIKDPAIQHIDVTRAIFFWRLDDMHQFQRYHDQARWNIALFLALLADERPGQPAPDQAHPARIFVIAYLAAVLEHHNEPANFTKREAFVKLWKRSKYDFFKFSAAQKMLMKKETKRLKNLWNEELKRIKASKDLGNSKKEIAAAYDAKVAKFVGILVPGDLDRRGKNHRAPSVAIKELQIQKPIKSKDVQRGVLLDALKVRSDDYWMPPSVAKSNPSNTGPVPTQEVLGHHEPSVEFLNSKAPKPIRASREYPALEFPKVSRFDVNKEAVTIVDTRGAITALRKTKPKAILVKLMQLFPPEDPEEDVFMEEAPAAKVATPELTADERSEEQLPDPGDSDMNLDEQESPGTSSANDSSQQDVPQAHSPAPAVPAPIVAYENMHSWAPNLCHLSIHRDSTDTTPPQLDALMMDCDESLLKQHTDWKFTADAPATTTGTSIFGGGN